MTQSAVETTPVPGWLLDIYHDIDTQQFSAGFACYADDAEMYFGTTHIRGVDAIRAFLRELDTPLTTLHTVFEFWDLGGVKIVRGEALIAEKVAPENVSTMPFVHLFYMSDVDPALVCVHRAVVGPADTDELT
ncbi:hypothetical protein FF36_04415 [Frankia torreyi]|uniref:SnoaL-like domain n=1 Tax=Frankia torreyi TaxID=1856 RepID=A0A0D8BAR7_9ACTN|nr:MULTISPECIES: hypothetical protein [Frankia]KJE21271.1 hypothetical protein FF36_04415 [Frankia torreyi]KQM03342.1 hypothetical protein FF86_104224 [Frankia sp. CpI1-P]